MSAFRRLMTALPASRRSYSVFSSKSGGGRYFNSAKSKTAPVVAAKSSPKPEPKDPQASTTATASTTSSTTPAAAQDGTSPSDTPLSRTFVADPQAPSPSGVPPTGTSSTNSTPTATEQLTETVDDLAASLSAATAAHQAAHASVSASDYKLHQFFSLHRPLLLLPTPSAMFAPVPPLDAALNPAAFRAQAAREHAARSVPVSVFDDFPQEAHLDADAIAARQLGRALAMSRIGAAVEWEATLVRLGLDPKKEPARIEMQEQMDKEWEDVQILLDSTKRKRRKKMKKHKLKKRRKATRSSRLKLK